MKTILSLSLAVIFSMAASSLAVAGEKEIWYDAKGNIVGVTRAEPEKEQKVPIWKKREQERLARLEAQRQDRYRASRSSSSSSIYWDPYSVYYYPRGGYGRSSRSYSSPSWSCRPTYYYNHGRSHRHSSFRGSYHGNGWSVRIGY